MKEKVFILCIAIGFALVLLVVAYVAISIWVATNCYPLYVGEYCR